MTLNKIMPWGRKQVPIRQSENYNPPSVWTDYDDPFSEMDKMFDRFFSLSPGLLGRTMPEYSPTLDVHETHAYSGETGRLFRNKMGSSSKIFYGVVGNN